MPEKKFSIFAVMGLSLLLALVIFIFTKYTGVSVIDPNMYKIDETNFGQTVNTPNENVNINSIESKTEIEQVFERLIQAYNEKNTKLLAEVDNRYATSINTKEGINYVKAINNCHTFNLYSVMIKDVTVKSISGYMIYSYRRNGEMTDNYVLSEYKVKSLNGNLVITYLNTVNTNYEQIKEYINQ